MATLHQQRSRAHALDAITTSNGILAGIASLEAGDAAARESALRQGASDAQARYDRYLFAFERGKGVHAAAAAEVEALERRALQAREAMGGIFAAQESAARLAARTRALRSQLAAAAAAHNQLLARGARAAEELAALRATRERQARDRAALARRAAAAAAARAAHLAAAEHAMRAHDGAVLAATVARREAQDAHAAQEAELEREDGAAAARVGAAAREPLAPFIGELTPEEEAALKQRLAAAVEEEARFKELGRAHAAALAAEEEGLSRLAKETGLASVAEALEVWSDNEGANFALYNALIAQTREMQRLEAELAALLREGAPHGARLWEVLKEVRGGGGGGGGGGDALPPPAAAAAASAHHHPLLRGAPATAMATVVQSLQLAATAETREAAAARAGAEAAAGAAAAEAALAAASGSLEALLRCCGGEAQRGAWALAAGAGPASAPAAALAASGGGASRDALLETLAIVERRTGALLGAYATLVEAAEREKGAAGGRALRILGVHPAAAAAAAGEGGGAAAALAAPLKLPTIGALRAACEEGDAEGGGRARGR
jgi:hypothetical protein